MTSAKPTRQQADLADVLELVLDKGIVINADIAITVGDTEMIGVELRAAIASFETAAEYGLAFPSGTDMRRVEEASGREPLEVDGDGDGGADEIDLGIGASSGGETTVGEERTPPGRRPDPSPMLSEDEDADDEDGPDGEPDADDGGSADEDSESEDAGSDDEDSESEDGEPESDADTDGEDDTTDADDEVTGGS